VEEAKLRTELNAERGPPPPSASGGAEVSKSP
jgi:N utilization substance protein A